MASHGWDQQPAAMQQKPMPVQRPGDWNCSLCGNHNFANRTVCFKCQQPPGPGTVQVPMGGNEQTGSLAGQGMQNAKPGDWSCALCGNHNFANRTVCNKCQQPPAPGSVQVPWEGGNQPGGMGGQMGGMGGQMGGMAPNAKPGDWSCSLCGNHNFANRTVCNKCQQPPAPGSVQVPGNNMGKGMNQMNQMGGFGMAKGGKGGGGDRAVPYGVAAHPGGSAKPGDWWCPSCSNHNYANKTACNRCGMPKPAAGQPLVQMEWPGQEQPVWQKVQMAQQMAMGQIPNKPSGGDWQCLECKNVNFANCDKCAQCQIPKATSISVSGMRPGDWLCPACQNHNYATKSACNKCQTPKVPEAVSTANMRDGDWLCPSCGNHNYANKAACNRCKLPKF